MPLEPAAITCSGILSMCSACCNIDENNPLNDYPDEDDFGDFGDQKSNNDSDETDFDLVGSDSGSDYDTAPYDNEQELRWGRRL